jgi:hypothetical protein
MPSIQIDSWQMLPSNGGGSLVVDGERMAVSSSARLTVWHGGTRLATAEAPSPAPGIPRLVGERVYWGPGMLDLASGNYTRIEAAAPRVRPGAMERPSLYAWSPQGEWLLASFSAGDPLRPNAVRLFNGRTGAAVATLWEGTGLPPQSAWLGERAAVLGFSPPQVFDYSGKRLAAIELGAATIGSVEATAREHRLMVLEVNRSIAWIDTGTWTILDRWPGPWLHGAVSPDGRFVVVLEPWGKLHFACLEEDRFKPAGRVAADPNAVALALAPNAIATVGGGEVRRANLTVDCA